MQFVSVILPVYNRNAMFVRAVTSVLNQTYPNLELIIIDDGSNPPVLTYVPPDLRVRYFYQKNKGAAAARNHGIKNATGSWIAFLDSDDEWLPSKLEKQINYINQHNGSRIRQTGDIWIKNGKRVNQGLKHRKKEGKIFFDSLNMCMISMSAVMIEKKLFDEVGLFNEKLLACEDYDLFLRMTRICQMGLINEKLIIRHQGHKDQLSFRYDRMDRFRIKALRRLLHLSLTREERDGVKNTLKKKCSIMAAGARKRKRIIRWIYYSVIGLFS